MTRAELIARIEAGEKGDEVLRAIANEVGWLSDDGLIPDWLTRIDAAAELVSGHYWCLDQSGRAYVWASMGGVHWANILGRPAAALVAAWLEATA